jgi:hypothetical protein
VVAAKERDSMSCLKKLISEKDAFTRATKNDPILPVNANSVLRLAYYSAIISIFSLFILEITSIFIQIFLIGCVSLSSVFSNQNKWINNS